MLDCIADLFRDSLNGKPVFTCFGKKIEKIQVSNSFVQEKGANMNSKDKLGNTTLIKPSARGTLGL
jgi:hypothetical protein